MKAVRLLAHGGPEALTYGDFPRPETGAGDVLVRVLATTVSRWDVKYRIGEAGGGGLYKLPMQPGRDAAGIVEAVGSEVKAFKPGDRVVGLVHPVSATGESLYPGHVTFGGNAQFVARPEAQWLALPATVEPAEAAAAMWSYATAHRILLDRLQSRLGDRLFVVGGTGGMGSAILDLARAMGVTTVAVTRSARKIDFLKRLGAGATIVLPRETSAIRAEAAPRGCDGAVDCSGDPAMMRLCVDMLRRGGTFVPVASEGPPAPLPVTVADCTRLELTIRGARASTIENQRAVLALLAERRIGPAIHAVMPLSELPVAHRLLEAGEVSGRIVLDPWR
ncbi:MAG TPA: zinc-binding alcohol dehydrogenase family protein [Stellaceae bacterium]|nr:zinc-binding alcohol dehydrogenase family protein [Stellaceae bacterium]